MSSEIVVICGASADIGLAILDLPFFQKPSLKVVVHCHRGAARLAPAMKKLGARATLIEADLSTQSGTEALRAASGLPTHLVYLPALPLVYERFTKFNWPRFLNDLEIQVGALVRLLPAWLPSPRRAGVLKNVVVVSSSVTVGVPPKYLAMYTMVKYAQLGLLRSLTAEYAEHQVSINAVSPSMVETRFLNEIPETIKASSAQKMPAGRNVSAQEVAEVVELFLAANRPMLTGGNLVLAGGQAF